jgi:nitrogen-specific signal transduction histidine kinase
MAASDLTGLPVTAIDAEGWYVAVNVASGAMRPMLVFAYTGLFMCLFYVFGLLLAATAVLVSQIARYEHLGPRIAFWLSLGVVGPWLVQLAGDAVAVRADLETGLVQLAVAATFVVAAGGMALVLERYDLFAVAPAAGTVGPERVLEDLGEPIVVVNHDERVVRLNPAARRAFGMATQQVGVPVSDLLGHDVASLRTTETLDIDGVDGHRHYEATVSDMTGRHGHRRGHVVVLRDVTGRNVRQQRLQVLNRVLRHNLRNDLTAIRGHAEMLGIDGTEEERVREVVVEKADDLIALSERAREVEQMLSVPIGADRSCDLAAVVTSAVDEVGEGHDATVAVTVPDDVTVGADARVLQPIVYNLVRNAIRHHDRAEPTIEVTATVDDGALPVELTVTDDGPGLPEQERIAIERGHENPLEHGSGLGLWAIKWGVTRLGGQLSIRDNEPRGTVVEIRLPATGATGPGLKGGTAQSAAARMTPYDSVSGVAGPSPTPHRDGSTTGPGPTSNRIAAGPGG